MGYAGYDNFRRAEPELAANINEHPYAHIFFITTMWQNYYQPIGTAHADVYAARLAAYLACMAHMDPGMSAIHLSH